MDKPLQQEWMSHFCGLCLTLRDEFGQPARLVTNYDTLVLSVLVEAQIATDPQRRTAGPCALRGMRTASIVEGTAARLAALAAVLLATAKIDDHIDDGDGVAKHKSVATVGRKVSARLESKALRLGDDIGFDAAGLLATVRHQSRVEAETLATTPLWLVTSPTEQAAAALFAHTAVIAGRPENAAALADAGAAFGRLAHLVDAICDLAADTERGSWNPLTATATSTAEAHRMCHAAVTEIDNALADMREHQLTRSLLIDHAQHAMRQSNPHYSQHHHYSHPPEVQKRGFWAGCGAALMLACTCRCCCSSGFEGPWSRKRREGCCHKCDCCNCDCNCCCDGC